MQPSAWPYKAVRGQLKQTNAAKPKHSYCSLHVPPVSPPTTGDIPANRQGEFIRTALDFVLRLEVCHVICVHSINGYDLVSCTQVGYCSFATWSHLQENETSECASQGAAFQVTFERQLEQTGLLLLVPESKEIKTNQSKLLAEIYLDRHLLELLCEHEDQDSVLAPTGKDFMGGDE